MDSSEPKTHHDYTDHRTSCAIIRWDLMIKDINRLEKENSLLKKAFEESIIDVQLYRENVLNKEAQKTLDRVEKDLLDNFSDTLWLIEQLKKVEDGQI